MSNSASDSRSLTCPSCGADVEFVVDDECLDCGDQEIIAIIERLRPE